MLERHSLLADNIWLFERPTKLEEGERGLCGWYEVFEKVTLDQLSRAARVAVVSAAERYLLPHPRRETPAGSHWIADYIRLRVVARRH